MVLRAGDLIEWEWDYNSHKSLFILLEDVESSATSGTSRPRTLGHQRYVSASHRELSGVFNE